MKVKLFSQLLCHQNNLLLLTNDLNHQQFGNDSNLLIVFYVQIGVRLENGKYPTLSLFFVQIASRVYGDS